LALQEVVYPAQFPNIFNIWHEFSGNAGLFGQWVGVRVLLLANSDWASDDGKVCLLFIFLFSQIFIYLF
jgi:hypothetical protein